jgi:hypothetical protein
MAHTISLTSEELALIEQKRAEKKALLNSYDYYKSQKIEEEPINQQTLMGNCL